LEKLEALFTVRHEKNLLLVNFSLGQYLS